MSCHLWNVFLAKNKKKNQSNFRSQWWGSSLPVCSYLRGPQDFFYWFISCFRACRSIWGNKKKIRKTCCSAWSKLNTEIGLHHHPPTHPPPTHHHKLFSQKGLCYNFEILHTVNSHKTNKIWGGKKIGVPTQPPWGMNSEAIFPPCIWKPHEYVMSMRASHARILQPSSFILHPSHFII